MLTMIMTETGESETPSSVGLRTDPPSVRGRGSQLPLGSPRPVHRAVRPPGWAPGAALYAARLRSTPSRR